MIHLDDFEVSMVELKQDLNMESLCACHQYGVSVRAIDAGPGNIGRCAGRGWCI
jgi:hypothetical protein